MFIVFEAGTLHWTATALDADKQELALLRESKDLPVPGRRVRNAIKAARADDCSELEGELSPREEG